MGPLANRTSSSKRNWKQTCHDPNFQFSAAQVGKEWFNRIVIINGWQQGCNYYGILLLQCNILSDNVKNKMENDDRLQNAYACIAGSNIMKPIAIATPCYIFRYGQRSYNKASTCNSPQQLVFIMKTVYFTYNCRFLLLLQTNVTTILLPKLIDSFAAEFLHQVKRQPMSLCDLIHNLKFNDERRWQFNKSTKKTFYSPLQENCSFSHGSILLVFVENSITTQRQAAVPLWWETETLL